MQGTNSPSLSTELVESTAWLRRVACALVGESAADDLVQQTFEVALKSKPGTKQPTSPWLRTVIKNLAQMRRRSTGRREAREQAANVPREPESPEASLAKMQIHQRVAAAVMKLKEPYRQVLILRYVDDLSSAEIARQLDVPASTVRSHLKRGLALLRADLDRDDDVNWRLAIAPFAIPTKAGTAGSPSMIKWLAWAPVGIAVVVLAVFLLVSTEDSSTTSGISTANVDSTTATPGGPEARAQIASNTKAAQRAPGKTASPSKMALVLKSSTEQDESPGRLSDCSLAVHGSPQIRNIRGHDETEFADQVERLNLEERMQDLSPLVHECFALSMSESTGQLLVSFVIDFTDEVGGYTRETAIHETSELRDEALSESVRETLLSLEFPSARGKPLAVVWPFEFGQNGLVSADEGLAMSKDEAVARGQQQLELYNEAPEAPGGPEHLEEAARCFEAANMTGLAVRMNKKISQRSGEYATRAAARLARLYPRFVDSGALDGTSAQEECDADATTGDEHIAIAACLTDKGYLAAALEHHRLAASMPGLTDLAANEKTIARYEMALKRIRERGSL